MAEIHCKIYSNKIKNLAENMAVTPPKVMLCNERNYNLFIL